MFDLAQFPKGTRFAQVDDIDRCILFEAQGFGEGNPQGKDRFNVAAWHDDLIALAEDGLISGVRAGSEREWEARRRNRLRQELLAKHSEDGHEAIGDPLDNLYMQNPDGSYTRISLPPLPTDDEDDYEFALIWALVEEGGAVTITPDGWMVVEEALGRELELPEPVAHVEHLISLGLYDTAVREVAVKLESSLRDALGGDGYGQKLLNDFFKKLEADGDEPASISSIYRLRLRTFFRFVRNPYAHRAIKLEKSQAMALLSHATMLLDDVNSLIVAMQGKEV